MGNVRYLAVLMLAVQAFGQVQVAVRSAKDVYLEGEPIFAVLRMTNVGVDPVAYSECDDRVELEVEGRRRRNVPNLWGCFRLMAEVGGCGVDHPPILAPGKSTEFKYLLKEYQLGAGQYQLRAFGKAPVRWKFYSAYRPSNSAPLGLSRFKEGDRVPGEDFDRTTVFQVRSGTEAELRAVYEPYASDAASPRTEAWYPAREAIAEMGPPFLEKSIKEFANDPETSRLANDPETSRLAVKGLQRIDTPESRADLIELFYRSTDLTFRAAVVRALAEMTSPDQLAFFATILQGDYSGSDEVAREWAALAIGRLGGDWGVARLADFLRVSSRQSTSGMRSTIAVALAAGKSKKAIPVLMKLYGDGDGLVRDSVCVSLQSLTHRDWCKRVSDQPDIQSPWQKWWKNHEATTRMYGFDECQERGTSKDLGN